MKAVYAGLIDEVNLDNAKQYLYICTRKMWEPAYYIPVPDFSKVQIYIDFANVKPSSFSFQLISLCNNGLVEEIVACHYIIGKDPYGNYYGVFQFAGVASFQFFTVAITAQMSNGEKRIYLSQAYEQVVCADLVKVEACYPDLQNSLSVDGNGIYSGSTVNEADSFGNLSVRYQHYAYVRQAKVFEDAPKATFSSNIRRNFKTVLEKIFELKTELVPKFYKDYLVEIYARGFITIDGVRYRVTELAVEPMNDEDYLWKPNCKLKTESHNYFGCAGEECETVETPCDAPCCDPEIISASSTFIEDEEGGDWMVILTRSGANLTAAVDNIGPYEYHFYVITEGACGNAVIADPDQTTASVNATTAVSYTLYAGVTYKFYCTVFDVGAGEERTSNVLTLTCLVPETLIRMADGSDKQIRFIGVNDKIQTLNMAGMIVNTRVTGKSRHYVDEIYNINYGLLKSTDSHVHVIRKGNERQLVQTAFLKKGDILVDANNEPVEILSIEIEAGKQQVINIATAAGTFIANGILTHNKAECVGP